MGPAVTLRRIVFLIHPYCWSMHPGVPPDRDPALWQQCLARERRNHQDHLAFIDRMGAEEALIVYPIGASAPMSALLERARARLGPRCFAVSWRVANPAPLLAGVAEPIRAWLDDARPLPGKDQYVRDNFSDFGTRPFRADAAAEVEDEIRQACQAVGYDWSPAALKVIYYNRVLALEIAEGFSRQGLTYDPVTVDCMAFGEGFSACAMTWKCMLSGYLGLARPIENEFDLSTEGLAFLNDARLRQRLDLGDDPRLLDEAADCPLVVEDGQLMVPVHTGRRRGLEGRYLLAPGMDLDGFAAAVTQVEVSPGPAAWSRLPPAP